MSFGAPSAKTPPRHAGPVSRRVGAGEDTAEQALDAVKNDTRNLNSSAPTSPLGGWLRSRLGGDTGASPGSPEPFASRASDTFRADNETLFRQGLFNAVGNAILLICLGLLYAVSSLLSQYHAPILWAVLVSLALRDVKVALVRFWTKQLSKNTLLWLAFAPIRAAVGIASDAAERVRAMGGVAKTKSARPGSKFSFRKSSSTSGPIDASTFHFRWLLVLGLVTELWSYASCDWDLTVSVLVLACAFFAAAATTTATVVAAEWYLFTRNGSYAPTPDTNDSRNDSNGSLSSPVRKETKASSDTRKKLRFSGDVTVKVWGIYVSFDAWLRGALVRSLHVLVATGLIVGGLGLVLMVTAFFTVNIAHESTEAVTAAREAVLQGSRSPSGFRGISGFETSKRSLQEYDADGRWQSAWSDAVETHWPAALDWAQRKVEEMFPGANATEVWEAMQHVYVRARETDWEGTTGNGDDLSWSTVVKRAGKMLGEGDVTGAFSTLRDVVTDVTSDTSDGTQAHASPVSVFLRVGGTVAETLRSKSSEIVFAVVQLTLRVSTSFFGVAGGVVSLLLQSTVFLTVLFHILSNEVDLGVRAVELLPVDEAIKKKTVTALTSGIRGVFLSCLKLASFHALFTWVTFRMFNVHFVYTSTLASGATAILPLLASWAVSLPAAASLVAKGQAYKGAALVLSHFVTLVFVDIDIYQSEIQIVHPYIVGLSVVGGMCVFEPALQGAVLGPLLVTALATGHALYRELVRPPPARGGRGGTAGNTARAPPSAMRRKSEGNLFRGMR